MFRIRYFPESVFAADQSPRGLDDPKCMILAELHSKAVRYALFVSRVFSFCASGGFFKEWPAGGLPRYTYIPRKVQARLESQNKCTEQYDVLPEHPGHREALSKSEA